MRRTAVVTGAAGFIGSHLVEDLIADGWTVRGIDRFTDYYPAELKRQNLTTVGAHPNFSLHQFDVADQHRVEQLLDGTSTIFHLAAEAGVRSSWGMRFDRYVHNNMLATQRLFEAAKVASQVERLVIASSSSVYGDAETFPTPEAEPLRPQSPYGITKAATEHLATAYATSWGLPAVNLRLFTVYGPRQRPDMAFHRLFEAVVRGRPFQLFGNGDQVRDFTYVGDVVSALRRAGEVAMEPGTILNVAGGTSTSLKKVIEEIEHLAGEPVPLDVHDAQAGDAKRTGGDTTAIRHALGWSPETDLLAGLQHQLDWHRARVSTAETNQVAGR